MIAAGALRLSRRHVLAILGVSSLSAILAACGGRSEPSSDGRPIAPAQGQLPPPPAGGSTLGSGTGPAVQPPPPAEAARQIAPAPPTAAPARSIATPDLLNGIAPEAPTAAPTQVPPTAVPPTQVPTVVPTATATPIAYDASRLKDRLASAQTSYAGSIAERAWNVELAAKRLDGTRIAPGEVFSFNQAVGATTLKAGFKIGYGIMINGDKPETVPSVAGGICQIATTVYQAAFWAGLPFVERHYHLYWIPRYGQPPSGKIGFDATVDDPGVDLKFRNTTGEWMRLDSWFDGSNVGFVLRGVDPGWEVESPKPKQFEFVKADPTIVRQDDPTMPAGRELLVEHAEDGFRVTVQRLVKYKGKTVDDFTYTNYYRPSRNVMLVGTKGAAPRPTVSASPSASAEATHAATSPTPAPAATRPAAPAGATAPPAGWTPVAPAAPPVTATPAEARLPNGQIRVPSVVGMPEAQARKTIEQVGLANTFPNYQGPGQVPQPVLQSVPVGSILSQTPSPGTPVPPGATIYLAVRKA